MYISHRKKISGFILRCFISARDGQAGRQTDRQTFGWRSSA